jgi:hypothetical protein
MNKISRALLVALAIVLVFAALAFGLALAHESGGMNGSLLFFDNDLCDSALGWMIAIPVLLLVAVIVATVCAGAALITIAALVLALILVALGLVLAITPLAIFLAIPVLAIYGLVKILQRNPAQVA